MLECDTSYRMSIILGEPEVSPARAVLGPTEHKLSLRVSFELNSLAKLHSE